MKGEEKILHEKSCQSPYTKKRKEIKQQSVSEARYQ
jgi:hypothetical protein